MRQRIQRNCQFKLLWIVLLFIILILVGCSTIYVDLLYKTQVRGIVKDNNNKDPLENVNIFVAHKDLEPATKENWEKTFRFVGKTDSKGKIDILFNMLVGLEVPGPNLKNAKIPVQKGRFVLFFYKDGYRISHVVLNIQDRKESNGIGSFDIGEIYLQKEDESRNKN